MSEMTDFFLPGVMLSETHFHVLKVRGAIADAVARVAEEGFYLGAEIPDISDPVDRKRIGDTVRTGGIRLTQWMSRVLACENLNLSSEEQDLRRRSVARVKEHIVPAAECGASGFAVLSGPDPGPELRAEAVEWLYISMCELAEALIPYQPMQLIIEPLDRGAHKNGLIGPTKEAADLIRRVRESHPNAGLSWDTAHAALCVEDLLESLSVYHEYMAQMHLANAVLDPAQPGHGDHHMPPGLPGFLTDNRMAEILRCAISTGFFGESRPTVSVEMRTPEGGDPWVTEAMGRQAMMRAWEICTSGMALP